MINMETPKCRKLRRNKGSSKKKKNVNTNEICEPNIEKLQDPGTSANITPPRRVKSFTVIERKQEEVRGVEWQYHGKFVESDVPVVWGSPHGSPGVHAVQTVCESPVYKPKRRTNSAPKKLSSDDGEPPQFLNEILALSEKIKAGEKNNSQLSNNVINEGEKLKPAKIDESFSNFFDEDMNECMLQCSQELEQTSTENNNVSVQSKVENSSRCEDQKNKKTLLKSEGVRSSPRKKVSTSFASKSLHTSSGVFHLKDNVNETETNSSRVGNKNYVQCKRRGTTYVFQGRVLGSRGHAETLKSSASGSKQVKINIPLQGKCSLDSKLQTNAPKLDRTSTISGSCNIQLNNSFNSVKESFLDEDIEFLSKIPDDLDIVPETKNKYSPKRKSSDNSDLKQKKYNQLQNASSVLEDSTYFEDGVLQYLDTIESNVVSSQLVKCTPEEIEKKRQEAKLKLQKKKLSAKKC